MGSQVIWIGGAPGTGKSTVARRIARRHGFRLYVSDEHVWDHRLRALSNGDPRAIRWQRLSHEERMAGVSAAELDELLLDAIRGPLIIEDVRTLPQAPLIVAEGTPILPQAVAAAAHLEHGVWFTASPEVVEQRLVAAGPPAGVQDRERALQLWLERARLVARKVEAQAATVGAQTLRVDALCTVEDVVQAVEQALESVLELAPRSSSRFHRRRVLRYENLAKARHQLLFFQEVELPVGFDRRYPFTCECGDAECDDDVLLTVPDFLRQIAVEGTSLTVRAPGSDRTIGDARKP